MEIIYRAKDGKEFDNEYECENYERSLCIHTFKMWDDEHEPLTNEEFNYYGYSHEGIDASDFIEKGYWENVENVINSYQKALDIIKKMMESVDDK